MSPDAQHQPEDPGNRWVRIRPWIPEIAKVTAGTEIDPHRLMGLMYVESWCGWAPGYAPKGDPNGWGDGGHAFGFFQIDKRYHADFIASPGAGLIDNQAKYAISLLQYNKTHLTGAASNGLLEKATYSAYNGPLGQIYVGLKHGTDPDAFTTGKDYAARVFEVADWLCRAHPDAFGGSNANVA